MSAITPKFPVTRLPFEVRENLCARIRDRHSWKQLNDWLDTRNLGPYKPQNYSAFKKSKLHYPAWLEQQRNCWGADDVGKVVLPAAVVGLDSCAVFARPLITRCP